MPTILNATFVSGFILWMIILNWQLGDMGTVEADDCLHKKLTDRSDIFLYMNSVNDSLFGILEITPESLSVESDGREYFRK